MNTHRKFSRFYGERFINESRVDDLVAHAKRVGDEGHAYLERVRDEIQKDKLLGKYYDLNKIEVGRRQLTIPPKRVYSLRDFDLMPTINFYAISTGVALTWHKVRLNTWDDEDSMNRCMEKLNNLRLIYKYCKKVALKCWED